MRKLKAGDFIYKDRLFAMYDRKENKVEQLSYESMVNCYGTLVNEDDYGVIGDNYYALGDTWTIDYTTGETNIELNRNPLYELDNIDELDKIKLIHMV